MRGNFGSRGLLGVCVAIVVLAAGALFVAPVLRFESTASAQSGDEREEGAFLTALNETRRDLGLNELIVSDELTRLSRVWAIEMAREGEIFHANPISANMTSDWLKLGENVGVGPEVGALMDAFIASPTHYENIIDPEFTHVGVGVVWEGDLMFTTHRFMKLADRSLGTPTTTPPDAAPPASDPVVETTASDLPTASTGDGTPVPPPATAERIATLVQSLQQP